MDRVSDLKADSTSKIQHLTFQTVSTSESVSVSTKSLVVNQTQPQPIRFSENSTIPESLLLSSDPFIGFPSETSDASTRTDVTGDAILHGKNSMPGEACLR